MTGAPHIPVMIDEVLRALVPANDEIYVDGTFGAGGYTRAILDAAHCRVVALDRDPNVAPLAENLKGEYGARFAFIVGNFADMCELLESQGIERVDGIVLDLGVSSMQLDQAERGFSFRHDGPLDMRMGAHGATAADLIAGASEEQLADIIYQYGEERAARRIAKAITQARIEQPITRTAELAEIVRRAVGTHGEKDPATRTFQALRIFLNGELESLQRGLNAAEKLLKPGGRLVVVTFHSLEDRMVKQFTYSRCGKLAGGSRHVPETAKGEPSRTFLLPSPAKLKPTRTEAQRNPRARSATLRAAIRTSAPPPTVPGGPR